MTGKANKVLYYPIFAFSAWGVSRCQVSISTKLSVETKRYGYFSTKKKKKKPDLLFDLDLRFQRDMAQRQTSCDHLLDITRLDSDSRILQRVITIPDEATEG